MSGLIEIWKDFFVLFIIENKNIARTITDDHPSTIYGATVAAAAVIEFKHASLSASICSAVNDS